MGSENKVSEQSRSEAKPRRPSLIARAISNEKSTVTSSKSPSQPEQAPPEREFGASADIRSAFKSRSIDVTKRSLERTDSSVSNGSIVAVMCNRYSRTVSIRRDVR
jgi:hypothetical protein